MEILTTRKNLEAMMDVPANWIDRVRQCKRRSLNKLIVDLNSSVSEAYERRERPRLWKPVLIR